MGVRFGEQARCRSVALAAECGLGVAHADHRGVSPNAKESSLGV